jgi:hypothetical protein
MDSIATIHTVVPIKRRATSVNTAQIIVGVIVTLLGIGMMMFSAATEKLAKAGELPPEKLFYISLPSGTKLPLLTALAALTIAPGVMLVVLAVLNYYTGI